MSELLPFAGAEDSRERRPPACYARVVVERGIDDRGGIEGLTYACADADLAVGERVEAPLGRGGTISGGVVVAVGGPELLGSVAADKIKWISRRAGFGLTPPLLELARWLAAYYCTPLGLVLATMLPAAVKQGVGRRQEARLSRAATTEAEVKAAGRLTPALRRAWDAIAALAEDEFPIAPLNLAAKVGPGSMRSIRRLTSMGLLAASTESVVRVRGDAVAGLLSGTRGVEPTPTPEQAAIIEGIGADVEARRFGVHLVRGVTGSGKTEVYIRVIRRALLAGRDAVVLVPEIALTPQTEEWFRARLGSGADGVGVAVLHSGLSASRRNSEWQRAASGAARVIVGPRSAVFAPVRNLGVLVVDEEHEGSYKHEQLPRYHARDVAIKRGQIEGCPVVLGSATPSLESWSNATAATPTSTPRYRLWELTRRVGGQGRMPEVRVVDMAEERRMRALEPGDGWRRQIGPTLERAIAETLDEGGQVILLLNRRGFANHICCVSPACGWVLECDDCDAKLVFHKDRTLPKGGTVRCHHCLTEQLLPKACPWCGRAAATLGTGTQRIEEELVARFGPTHGLAEGTTLLRVDADTMGRAQDYFDALSRFGRGEVRLIVGTQMIAKGLDFPNVRLVGVVSADTALSLPDFRAGERTFQLVSQVAGRAGRGEHAGRVVVQTFAPEDEAILAAAAHDFPRYASAELALRRAHALPPATRMVRVVCRDVDAESARSRAAELAGLLKEHAGLRVAGPMEAPIARIATHHRWEVQAFAEKAGPLQAALTSVRSRGLLKSDSRTAVDVDPVSLL